MAAIHSVEVKESEHDGPFNSYQTPLLRRHIDCFFPNERVRLAEDGAQSSSENTEDEASEAVVFVTLRTGVYRRTQAYTDTQADSSTGCH